MKIGFIGAGKVGFSLGKYFESKGITVTGFYSRSEENAKEASAFTNTKFFSSISEIVKESDTLFLTVTDNSIGKVYNTLPKKNIKGKLICHCSGALSAGSAFTDAQQYGIQICSVHPLIVISDKHKAYGDLEGGFFAIEGSDNGVEQISQLLNRCGNPYEIIDAKAKGLYHCSASVACNLVNGLIDMSLEMLEGCGFSRENALKALTPIVTKNINAITKYDTAKSLTGPVERCDTSTITKHLNCLKNQDREIYRLISQRLVKTAERKHPTRDYTSVIELLNGEENEEK
jgi:predicted short-subunit dehydrogenase-like oxidoreductase (DUF2520 family)